MFYFYDCLIVFWLVYALIAVADARDAVLLLQLVVDWLEHSSASMLDNFYNKVDFSSDHMGAWYISQLLLFALLGRIFRSTL